MKLHLIAITLALAGLESIPLHAQAPEPELRWGEFGHFSNWRRYGYEIKSAYPFIGRLPDLRDFPKILTAALDPKLTKEDREIALSQLRTLSRCDFVNHSKAFEVDYRDAVAKWEQWWNAYGKGLAETLPKTGKRNEAAWKQVAPTPYLECPKYPISIPKVWSSTITFRSGDYGGFTEEVIQFQVDETTCTLKRRYGTGWPGKAAITHEVWAKFTREEADHFLASHIYAIDNPWFYADDESVEESGEKDELKFGFIRGRPKAWTAYHPGYDWSGILDTRGSIVINHDPVHWDTIGIKAARDPFLDHPAFGPVFRLVRDLFPDPSWDPNLSRWTKVATPAGAAKSDGTDASGSPDK